MNREDLLNKVRKCSPYMGWESKYPDLYGKYGMGIYGIREGWHWFEEENITDYARKHGHAPLTDATNEELLTMWALASDFWLSEYEKWYDRSQKKAAKLDRFIGECERKYFGYDEDGYTDRTIERIFNSIFEVLNRKDIQNIKEYIEKNAVSEGFLQDWYQASIADDPPVWTDEHIAEVCNDFYLIPKEVVEKT